MNSDACFNLINKFHPAWKLTRSQRFAYQSLIKESIILLVEDQPDQINLFTQIIKLVNPKLKVITAPSGQEAIKLIEKHKNKISLSIIDLTLPDMDGSKIIKHCPDIPSIVLTASTTNRKLEMIKMGAKHYLQKGTKTSLKQLIKIIQEITD
jgi:DNA-binding NtrC family response regulator